MEPLEYRVVLDGDFAFALGFGSNFGADAARAVAADGNVYVTGSFQGIADFDPGPDTTPLSALGPDVFVAKYTSTGALVWARQFGGAATDQANGVAVDGAGNVYTTGQFSGTGDFDMLDSTLTEMGGVYAFTVNDEFGTYRIRENQPTGVTNGAALLGSAAIDSVFSANEMQLTLPRHRCHRLRLHRGRQRDPGRGHGRDRLLAAQARSGFDQPGRRRPGQLAECQLRQHLRQHFLQRQLMATALAAFFTSSNLSGGSVAAGYGFNVTATGIGTRVVNVGSSGAAFGVANDTNMTILSLLRATNSMTGAKTSGYSNVYDTNGDGVLDAAELALRARANAIYGAINGG